MTNDSPRYTWRRYDGRESFARAASEWKRVADNVTPLADPVWVESMIEAFEGLIVRPTVHALYDGDRLVAVLPLERWVGLARVWTSIDNEHTPYWAFPADGAAPAAARAILDHLLSDSDYLFFRRFHLESPASKALAQAAEEKRLPTSILESDAGDTVVALKRPWATFVDAMPKKLMKDTAYQLRRLEKMGKLELEILTSAGPGFDAAFADCLEIEASGWKGAEGSPIKSKPETLRFYGRLASGLSERGRIALCLLRLDGKIIAFEYWLRGGGHIELLKISFDPAFAKNSPGYVLRYLALKNEIEKGEASTYHMGRPSPWKERWATAIQPLCSMRIYAPTLRGRAAFLAGPVLRARLKQMPIVQRARSAFDKVRRRNAPSPTPPPADIS